MDFRYRLIYWFSYNIRCLDCHNDKDKNEIKQQNLR